MDSLPEEADPPLWLNCVSVLSLLSSSYVASYQLATESSRCQCARQFLFFCQLAGVAGLSRRTRSSSPPNLLDFHWIPTILSDSRPIFLCRALLKVVSRAESVLIHRPSGGTNDSITARGGNPANGGFACISRLRVAAQAGDYDQSITSRPRSLAVTLAIVHCRIYPYWREHVNQAARTHVRSLFRYATNF